MEVALVEADLGALLELLDDGGPGPLLLTRTSSGGAHGRKQLRMDQFYAWMRKRIGLMEGTASPWRQAASMRTTASTPRA